MTSPKTAYYLTLDDVMFLRKLKHEADMLRQNSSLRNVPEPNRQAADFYIAKPTEDLAAMDTHDPTTGTGTFTTSIPGYAICDIYKIRGDQNLELVGRTETVFNTSGSSFTTDDYITVAKDKFGRWIVATGGGGNKIVHGRATDPVVAASNGLTGATQFNFKKWLKDDASFHPQHLKEDTEFTLGVNRWTEVSGPVDSIVLMGYIDGEWRLMELQEVCS